MNNIQVIDQIRFSTKTSPAKRQQYSFTQLKSRMQLYTNVFSYSAQIPKFKTKISFIKTHYLNKLKKKEKKKNKKTCD